MDSGKTRPGTVAAPDKAFALPQPDWAGMASANLTNLAEIQRIVAANSGALTLACIEAAVAAQREMEQMAAEAISYRDPLVLQTLPQRMAQSGLRLGMACSTLSLQATQTLFAQALHIGAPASGGKGSS